LKSEFYTNIFDAILLTLSYFRSCLLQVGDQIISVDGNVAASPNEVLRLFTLSAEVARLKIFTLKRGSIKSQKCPNSPSMSYSLRGSSSTLSSGMSTLKSQKLCKTDSHSTLFEGSVQSRSHRQNGVSHCESVAITLQAAPGGYGITLEGSWPPVIAEIEQGSPADM